MPAPYTYPRPLDVRPALGHVNLMVDTFIANANVDDLRSITRSLLATGPPSFVADFTNTARSRLRQTNAKAVPSPYSLFIRQTHNSPAAPTQQLHDTLLRARSLYGAGMGFASLGVLASIVRASIGLRWEDNGVIADILAVIDADIGQAIQSSKEEIEGGRVSDISSAREIVNDLRGAVSESLADTKSWGGEFPFDRASWSIQYWKI
ncbi:hypothetical protein BDZ94DRAFT_1219232 [Collybia nuda]|uniref:Uncharacterized protein n=1 Tax=Collybia nuda TaxID=64659 RepID=A0A9P5Y7R5_9AGAR|nr:hypothetical protein BDZ94DRAFT_1219232 [Collybia nuda]